ncbi:MAG: hypothetical protein HYV39_02685 [Candidatus Levybacteria bacterium]|nr:hypothetical protein [Candidatus Levybacteria bacterium]
MITIIHGDDIVSSRKYFLEQKEKAGHPIYFEGEKLTLTDLMQISEGGMLFSDEKKVFIEDFFSKRKLTKETSSIINYIKRQEDVDIFFWDGKILAKKQTETFSKAVVKTYLFPKTLFTFLDSLSPGNGKKLISMHNQVLKTIEVELVFFMIIRQFRLLLGITFASPIDEVGRLAPWQSGKLQKQANLFSQDQLKALYKKLYEIDLGIKTGKSFLPLRTAVDFFLLEI